VQFALGVLEAGAAVITGNKAVENSAGTSIDNFEAGGRWVRGTQSYGALEVSSEQVHGGSRAAKINYSFPAAGDTFVVFQRAIPLRQTPGQLGIWVYGDGSGNYLNAWLRDGAGKRWQYTFGRITHTGWAPMTALLNPNAGWPNGPLDGQKGTPAELVGFEALVIDGVQEGKEQTGVLYVDDLEAR
jgi:hypothetical protein